MWHLFHSNGLIGDDHFHIRFLFQPGPSLSANWGVAVSADVLLGLLHFQLALAPGLGARCIGWGVARGLARWLGPSLAKV